MAQSTVARYLPRPRKPPSQTWRALLTKHLAQTTAIDFFTVPTASFRVLFVFVVLAHERRRVVHFGVTEHPTQEWTMQQVREAFPWDQAPRYVLRDRDAIYGRDFAAMARDMEMEEVLTAPRSPWQNPFVERLVGPSDASAWTTLSCGMRDRCVALCTVIFPTISGRART
jgi:putative transposase